MTPVNRAGQCKDLTGCIEGNTGSNPWQCGYTFDMSGEGTNPSSISRRGSFHFAQPLLFLGISVVPSLAKTKNKSTVWMQCLASNVTQHVSQIIYMKQRWFEASKIGHIIHCPPTESKKAEMWYCPCDRTLTDMFFVRDCSTTVGVDIYHGEVSHHRHDIIVLLPFILEPSREFPIVSPRAQQKAGTPERLAMRIIWLHKGLGSP